MYDNEFETLYWGGGGGGEEETSAKTKTINMQKVKCPKTYVKLSLLVALFKTH